MKHMKKIILFAALAVVIVASGLFFYRQKVNYQNSHIFIGDAVYPKDAQSLDLRNTGISITHYEAVREQLPDCDILWDVPFQGSRYSSDITELTVTSLTQEDIAFLDYFPNLTAINATACTDYSQIMMLRQLHPEIAVSYQVTLGGESYPESTTDLTFTDADPAELLEKLQYLPALETIHFPQPTVAAENLLALREAYPNVDITWDYDVYGTTYPHDVTELDFSGTQLESLDYLEAAMVYFPELEKLILCDCGIDNDTMAEYRDRVRESYKVVWSVKVNALTIRTDELTFMPAKHDLAFSDQHLDALKYCEDLLCVDLGHYRVSNVEWLYGTPHMKYLVLADTNVRDITPVGSLKELVYFEVFKTGVTDYSPLVGCTALQDANLAFTNGDASVFAQMPWLNNLWVNCCGVDQQTRAMLLEALPDTNIDFDSGWQLGNNWRALLNYFKMRDLLEMPYYDWGNTLGRPGDPGYPYTEEE